LLEKSEKSLLGKFLVGNSLKEEFMIRSLSIVCL
jgi:hypothetical protein